MKPNIIFLFSDQQRPDTMGCYGQELPVTPNLDRLAKEGVLYEHAYTCQPVCGPARACLQTGKYATELGCYRNHIALPSGEKTIAHYLNTAGYQTAYVGKWHLASTGGKSNQPLEPEIDYRNSAIPLERRGGYTDYWMASDTLETTTDSYGGYVFDRENQKHTFQHFRVDAMTDYAMDFIANRRADKPFFLFLSYLEPHHQTKQKKYKGPDGSKERWKGFTPPEDLLHAPGDWGADWEHEYPDYLGCCHRIDENVGRILAQLQQEQIDEDTIIIYASDHGSHFKTRTVEYKRSCHDSSIHIPLVIKGKGFTGGRREEKLVGLLDLTVTILKIAGISETAGMEGRALQDIQDKDWENEVFVQISESQVGRCIRTERYTYSVRAYHKHPWEDSGSMVYHEEYLYDCKEDPNQFCNLIRDPRCGEIREQLRSRLLVHMERAGEEPAQILPAIGAVEGHLGLNAAVKDLLEHPVLGKGFCSCMDGDEESCKERIIYSLTQAELQE